MQKARISRQRHHQADRPAGRLSNIIGQIDCQKDRRIDKQIGIWIYKWDETESNTQGRTGRAFRAFPGRPWRRTQDSVGYKTDDKGKEKKELEKGKMCKENKIEEREREKWTEINYRRQRHLAAR